MLSPGAFSSRVAVPASPNRGAVTLLAGLRKRPCVSPTNKSVRCAAPQEISEAQASSPMTYPAQPEFMSMHRQESGKFSRPWMMEDEAGKR